MKCSFRFLQTALLCLLCSPLFSQENICIDSVNAPEETSIAFSTVDPAKMVAGANITCYYYSSDTGRTWKNGTMKSSFGVWGDPIVLSDVDGNFYFFHLSTPAEGHWLDRMVCQKSTDGGKTWSDGTYTGMNGEKNQDKPGCAIDLTHSKYRNRIYIAWTQFDHYASFNPLDSSRIMFSYSADGATTWSKPVRIDHRGGDCLDGDNTLEGAVPAVGPNGEVYVSWAGPQGLVFNKSMDGGETWLPCEKKLEPVIGGWDYNVPGIDRCDGLPITCCDVSNSPYKGTIYINWSDQRNGSDNTDVWFIKSADKGETWTKPVRINDDKTISHQFMSWLTVDQSTGYLYCLYFDRSTHTGDTTDAYLAISKDGGNSFTNFRINDRSFKPDAIDFFGDYISVKATNNIVRPIWMQLNKHKLSIWTALLNTNDLDWVTYKPAAGAPANNPVHSIGSENKSLWFTYFLHEEDTISLSLINMQGKKVCDLYTNKPMKMGRHEYIIDLTGKHIPDGAYAYKLDTHLGSIYKPIVIY